MRRIAWVSYKKSCETINYSKKLYRIEKIMNYSVYYQARVQKELCWMVTSTLRFCEHVAFDRTLEKDDSIFEFFVAPDMEDVFLDVAHKLLKRGIFLDLQKLPNRLMIEDIV